MKRGRRERESDLERELRSHLELEAEDQQTKGMVREQAQYAARRALGNETLIKEEIREAWGWAWIERLKQDFCYALRMFRKSPGFTAAATITLALGIGANTAMFSVVDAVLFRALPFPQPDRLIRIWGDVVRQPASLAALRATSKTVDYAAYSADSEYTLAGEGEPQRFTGSVVTANAFDVLGVHPQSGRGFQAADESPAGNRVVLISAGFWKRRLAGDPNAVGRVLMLDDVPRKVVGVMPASLRFPTPRTEFWLPLRVDPTDIGAYWWSYNLNIIGRLRAGFTQRQAEAELRVAVPRIRDSFPWKMWPDWGAHAHVISLQESLVGDARPRLLFLLAAVSLVLVIACVNLANILLARGVFRQQEITVRATLGASRFRLVRQLLTESVLLSLSGAAAGLVLAGLASRLLVYVLPAEQAQRAWIQVDARVLAFAAAVAMITGLAFGILPALRISKARLQGDMRADRVSTSSRARRRISSALVAFELAIAVIVVVSAGLLARSFWALVNVYPGFQSNNVLTASVTPSPSMCADGSRYSAFYREVLEKLQASSGVRVAAAASPLPLSGEIAGGAMELDGHPVLPGHSAPTLWTTSITPGYFNAMSIPILSGRGLLDSDREGTALVAVVTAATAERWWPGENPLGKRLRLVAQNDWRTVVGVVGNTLDAGLAGQPDWLAGHVYLPMTQAGFTSPRMSVIVKVAANPLGEAAAIRRSVREISSAVPVTDVRSMQEVLEDSLITPRSTMWVLFSFAALALVLSGVGVYSVTACAVAQRTREIGIRMALGSSGRTILKELLRGSGVVAAIGLAAGTASAYAVTRTMSALLFEVKPHDEATFIGVPALLLALCMVATYVPARRAMSIDPATALRHE